MGTLGVGIDLEGSYLIVGDVIRGRDTHLGQRVGEDQFYRILIVARTRAVQQVGKAVGLVAEIERGGRIPGIDGVVVTVAPVKGCVGGDCAVGLHDVGGSLCAAFYLHAYLFIAVPLAAHAVPVLADAGLRCAPRLRFASLHAEGDGGYLQGVLSFGQPGIVRQLVLRAGSRCKEYRSYGKKYLNGMSFLHIALFFCSCFVLPPPARAAVAP